MKKRISKFQRIKNKIKLPLLNLLGEKLFRKLRTIYWVRKLKKEKFYESEINLLPYFVHTGDICIDIGANFGQYTHPLSKLVGPEGKVFSFEPVNHAFRILRKVIKKLKLTNVKIQQVALGNKKGEREFVITFGGGYLWNRKKINNNTEKVKIITLDELSEKLPILSKTSFIKCDVEGTELMVFKGGKKLILKARPIILSEIEENWTKRYGYLPRNVFNFLGELGYKSFIFSSGKLREVKGIKDFVNNYVFIHKSLISNLKEELYENSSSK